MPQVARHRRSRGTGAVCILDLPATRFPHESVCIPQTSMQEHPMLDVIMLAIGLAFFALSIGYTIACDRL